MRLSSSSSTCLLSLPLLAHAGLFDRLRSPSSVDGAAPPQPPSEPSVDAFGGSGSHATAVFQEPVQAGAPSVARGQPAVQTGTTTGAQETASPVNVKEEVPYEGREYRIKAFRIRPAELKTEGITTAFIALFVLAALAGRRANKAQALAWWKANIHTLDEQFASFASKPESLSLVRADPGTYLGFASGRRGTTGLSIRITTLPLHDIPGMIYYLGNKIYDLTHTGSYNTVSLDFDLPSTSSSSKQGVADDFVFALVKKNYMQELRSSRFDLQAFTSVTEPNKDLLGGNEEFVTMVEMGGLNDWFLKRDKIGIRELFTENKRSLEWLQGLTISDVVQERPDEGTLEKEGSIPKSRKMILTMTLPPASRAEETRPLVELALNLLDVMAGSSLSTDMANKAKRRRTEVHSLLLSESRKEAKEKSIAAQSAIKKKAEQDKMDKMTPQEKKKYELRMRDKEMKKMALKQQKK